MRTPQDVGNRDAQAAPGGSTHGWDAIAERLGDALDDGRSDEELRAIVHQWCAEARRRNLAPEQFLVVIKSQFARLPALQRHPGDNPAHTTALNRLVSMCIEEYFRAA